MTTVPAPAPMADLDGRGAQGRADPVRRESFRRGAKGEGGASGSGDAGGIGREGGGERGARGE